MARKARSRAQRDADAAVGKQIAALRKARAITQVELADRMGIIQSLVSHYERGRLRPHPEMLSRFADALGVSVDEILGREDDPPSKATAPLDRRFVRRIQLVRKLPKRDQDALLRTIDAFLAARKAS
jgi:transcriptional regulator with XRE-family HTH domain